MSRLFFMLLIIFLIDIDECEYETCFSKEFIDKSLCYSFGLCRNLVGSFMCECFDGFEYDEENGQCVGNDSIGQSYLCEQHIVFLSFAKTQTNAIKLRKAYKWIRYVKRVRYSWVHVLTCVEIILVCAKTHQLLQWTYMIRKNVIRVSFV